MREKVCWLPHRNGCDLAEQFPTVDVPVKPALIGIDLGTTVCKGVVTDELLNILAQADCSCPIVHHSDRIVEQDANSWWQSVAEVTGKLAVSPGISDYRIRGISVSTQGLSVVPVNDQFEPLRQSINWLDTRAEEQLEQILQSFDKRSVFEITGKQARCAYTLPKILWIKQHEPRIYDRAFKLLMPLDFINAHLSGATTTDHTMASGTLCYDINKQTWSGEILDKTDVDENILPEIGWSGEPLGPVREAVADQLGLPREVMVSIGGQDQKVAALGAGLDLQLTTLSLGTAVAVTQKSDNPIIDTAMRIPCFTDLLQGRWVLEGSCAGTSGFEWMRGALFPDKSYGELDALVEGEWSRPSPLFFYPFFTGSGIPGFHDDLRGFIYGLDYSVSAGQIVRSLFEGVAYRIRIMLEIMAELGNPVEALRLFGGGSKSDIWCRIIASITAKPVTILTTAEAGSVGAAILAGLGTGIFTSPEEAQHYLKVARRYEPESDAVRYYEQRFCEYRDIEHRISGGENS